MDNELMRLVLADFLLEPWAILPARFATVVQAVARYIAAGELPAGAVQPAQPTRNSGAVAVIPIKGIIFPRGGAVWSDLFGGTSAERVAGMAQQAASDKSIDAVVLDVDSPGGSVAGVTEAAAAVRDLALRKPVVAVANHLAASAAYWIASQASEMIVSPSSEVGSIGVFAVHQDMSRMLEEIGLSVSLISAGKYKTEGNPYEPLTDEARSAIQARIDDYYAVFVRDVARGRNTTSDVVRGGFGEGRVVGARDAIDQGMADSVGTLADAMLIAAKRARARARSPNAELEFRQRRARLALE